MNLSVSPPLVLHVTFDDLFVGILPYGVHVEPARPEVPAPEEALDLGVMIEDMFGGETLDDLRNARGGEERDTLEEKVDMVFIRADLDEADFVALLDVEADILESLFDWFGKGFSSVLHRADQVIEKEGFVVTFVDVFAHPSRLHLRASTPHATCEESQIEARWPAQTHGNRVAETAFYSCNRGCCSREGYPL